MLDEQPPQPTGPQEVDVKEELAQKLIALKNAEFQVEMIKAIVAKLKELAG